RSTPRQLPSQGKDNLTVSISTEVLQEARRLKGQIQMSQVVEQALAEKIREIHHPEKAEILRRLRTEKSERKGPTFSQGFAAGKTWAGLIASWAEIREYAKYGSYDVILAPEDRPDWFDGPFQPPLDDYPEWPIVSE